MPSLVAVRYVPDRHAGAADCALAKLRRLERHKRNPRPAEYMRELARVTLGSRCEIIEVPPGGDPSAMLTADRLAAAEEVVLLWPDAIGHGWWPVERAVFAARPRGARVTVLSGRRRRFTATAASLLPFRIRRAVERLWLGEIALAAGLLLAAPFLVAWDAMRERT